MRNAKTAQASRARTHLHAEKTAKPAIFTTAVISFAEIAAKNRQRKYYQRCCNLFARLVIIFVTCTMSCVNRASSLSQELFRFTDNDTNNGPSETVTLTLMHRKSFADFRSYDSHELSSLLTLLDSVLQEETDPETSFLAR